MYAHSNHQGSFHPFVPSFPSSFPFLVSSYLWTGFVLTLVIHQRRCYGPVKLEVCSLVHGRPSNERRRFVAEVAWSLISLLQLATA